MAGWLDQSFLSSYRNAARRKRELEEEYAANDNDSWFGREDEYNAQLSALRSQQGQAVAGGLITGLTGATTLLSNAYKDAQIRDTSRQEGQIADLYNAGNYNYNNYDQLANDYAQTDFRPYINYDDIRGMNTTQKIGSIGTSALTGASTGYQLGGIWGGILGGIVGLESGITGVFAGDKKALERENLLRTESEVAAENARQNFMAAHERIGDNIHRQNAVNAVAKGGPIRRQTIKEYADKVLMNKPKMREHNGLSNIQKIKGEGGLTIRFKK